MPTLEEWRKHFSRPRPEPDKTVIDGDGVMSEQWSKLNTLADHTRLHQHNELDAEADMTPPIEVMDMAAASMEVAGETAGGFGRKPAFTVPPRCHNKDEFTKFPGGEVAKWNLDTIADLLVAERGDEFSVSDMGLSLQHCVMIYRKPGKGERRAGWRNQMATALLRDAGFLMKPSIWGMAIIMTRADWERVKARKRGVRL